MSVHKQILEWSKTQPEWRQDAMRRLLAGTLSAEDEVQLLKLLKSAHGLEDADVAAIPPADIANESVVSPAKPLRLTKVYGVGNANRLAADQTLSFALDGVTLIYGDNGSGKSGYARILKRACSARSAAEPILNDIFAKTPAAPATAKIEFVDGEDAPSTIDWIDGKTENHQLRRISVFDSKCAAVYVDNENQATFVPFGLDCFERLASLCDRLRVKLSAELRSLQSATAIPVVATIEGTAAHTFLATLGTKTDSEFKAATRWIGEEDARLVAITPLVSDAEKRAVALGLLRASAEAWANLASLVAKQLSNDAVDALKKLKADLLETEKAARVAGKALPGYASPSTRLAVM